MNETWCIHTVEYCLALKGNKIVLQITEKINIKYFMLTQIKRYILYDIFYLNLSNRQNELLVIDFRASMSVGGGGEACIGKEHLRTFSVDGNILYLDVNSVHGYTHLSKLIKLYD